MEDHGYHALGKFSCARDDILHFLCINEWGNDSTGNSVDWNVYAWKISNDPADVHIPNTEITSILEDWFTVNPEVTDSPELRSELVGHFLVMEYSGGRVEVATYPTEAERDADFRSIEADYYAWESQDDED